MKTPTTKLTVLAVLAAASMLAACEKKTTTTDTPSGTTTSTTTVSPSTAASNAMSATASAMNKAGDATVDAAITGKVKTKLLADPDVKGLAIDVDTKDGVVTLNGSADKAVAIAKGTDGVKSVENKLTVK